MTAVLEIYLRLSINVYINITFTNHESIILMIYCSLIVVGVVVDFVLLFLFRIVCRKLMTGNE